jgi:putative transposase
MAGEVSGRWGEVHYCIIDIFSRYVPQWLVAEAESAELAKDFLEDAVLAQGVDRDTLTIHADRGSSMRSKPVSQLLIDLGVARSHSRPHVSNDNPYSEAAFKTLKYCPAFPDRFGSIEDARAFCVEFFEQSRYAGDPRIGRVGQRCWSHRHDRRPLWSSRLAWFGPWGLPAMT